VARPLRLAFAGTPPFAVAALDALQAAGHEISAVFTRADRPAGRGRVLQQSAVKQRAAEIGLPLHQPQSFKSADAISLLQSLELDAFVVAAYGLILPAAVLDVPKYGCLNIHASLLPRWRGAAPIQRAILAGDALTGVSIMRMGPGLDTGPVLAALSLEIGCRDTAGSLQERLAAAGAALICRTLEALAAGTATLVPQSLDGVRYAAKIDKSEAAIDWRADAAAIVRQVRAFNPWPVAETRLRGARLRIWDAMIASRAVDAAPPPEALAGSVLAASKDGIDVACGQGVVRITRLQLPGRKVLSAAQFANSEALRGARFAAQ